MNNKIVIEKRRIKVLKGILFIVVVALVIRLYFLQVHPSEVVAGEMINHQLESISDMKYRVLDTTGKDMIKSNIEYIMVLDTQPFMLNNYEETIEDLMALNFIMKSENPDFNYTDIMNKGGKRYYKISEETYLKINKLENIKGIYTYKYEKVDIMEAWRVESIFSDIGNKKVVEDSLDWELNQYIGNNELPKARFYLDEKAVYGEPVIDMGDAKNIRLTIDKDLQEKIREILRKDKYDFMKNVGVIVSEADTGKIRALVQKDETQANINLGIEQMGYEPGSILKTLTEAIGLELGLITTDTSFPCKGRICSRNGKAYEHGRLTVEDAMEVSCNDIIAAVGWAIGYDKMMEYCDKIGFFERVLNIQGENKNESMGIKPKEDAGLNNISIGQAISVTPIQMTALYNTIANNGVYVKPTIVEAIVDVNNNIIKEYKNEEMRIFSETTAKITQDTLSKAISEGLGYEARVEGVEVGGKTGTSTGQGRGDHGWFAGYFVYNNKKYTIVVLAPNLEEDHPNGENAGGGNTGAPIFKDIVKSITEK